MLITFAGQIYLAEILHLTYYSPSLSFSSVVSEDAILYYFGWSQFDAEELKFSAPWKWNYCVVAVVVFLLAMEIIKLCAVNFIVWTKR